MEESTSNKLHLQHPEICYHALARVGAYCAGHTTAAQVHYKFTTMMMTKAGCCFWRTIVAGLS